MTSFWTIPRREVVSGGVTAGSATSGGATSGATVAAVAEFLRRRTGIRLPEYRLPVLATILARLARDPVHRVGGVEDLRRDPVALEELLHAVTVPETYFFRHFGHYRALADLAARRLGDGRACRVLCAGCATGEEAWAAAAVLARTFLPGSRRFSVEGWDVDAVRIRRAERGRFRVWSVRDSFHRHERFFRRTKGGWEVDEALRPFVRFHTVNLVSELPEGQVFDAVFFRNVAIYWETETIRRVARQLVARLPEDGLFFTGPCDPVDLPRPWSATVVDQVPVYRRQPAERRAFSAEAPRTSRQTATRRTTEARRTPARRAAARPWAAVRPVPAVAASRSPEPPPEDLGRGFLDEARELGDRGRTTEALALIEAQEDPLVPPARMLAGILLLELDRVEEAARRFQQAVFLDGEEPAYRHWLAVAFERLGRTAEANREYRNARQTARPRVVSPRVVPP